MAMDNELFEIIVGTYEEYLLGYKLLQVDKDYKLRHTIASHSHKASLRSVTVHDKYLASGGADESIHLYDLHLRKECGLLMHHSGTVTCLSFTPDGHYLISGSEDGSISMFGVGSWIVDKVWSKAHKGKAVNFISVHPSGKLALSVGGDCTLRTWNLVKGRCAYTVNIASKCKRPEIIEWSVCGEYFGLVNESSLEIYNVSTANVVQTIQLEAKITCIQFLKDNKVCIGTLTGTIVCFDFLTSLEIWTIPSKEVIRVKCLKSFENWLVTANSNGIIYVYDISNDQKPYLLKSLETSCRITCMTLSHLPSDDKTQIKIKKRKKDTIKSKFDCVTIKKIKISSPIGGNDKNVHCYPSNQKWQIEIL